jgi:hypothetical protein
VSDAARRPRPFRIDVAQADLDDLADRDASRHRCTADENASLRDPLSHGQHLVMLSASGTAVRLS